MIRGIIRVKDRHWVKDYIRGVIREVIKTVSG